MKRRWWIALGSAGVVVIGDVFLLSLVVGDPINQENFEKIQDGMTEADVVRLLGRSANDVTLLQYEDLAFDQAGTQLVETRTVLQKTWQGRKMSISVVFNEDGTVDRNLRFVAVDTIFSKIRRWLNLDGPPSPPPAFPVVAPAPPSQVPS